MDDERNGGGSSGSGGVHCLSFEPARLVGSGQF